MKRVITTKGGLTATLMCADCMDVLPTLGKVDAVITDPPYGISYKSPSGAGLCERGDYPVIHGDDQPFDPEPWLIFDEVVLFGANHYADKLPASAAWLVWDKRDGVTSNNNSDCELAWKKTGGSARLVRHLWNGMLKGSERDQKRRHPTQKPVAVMSWVIEQCGTPKTILDPFMGSGTTGVAALRMGCNFIGVELEPKYFDIAVRRIQAEAAQGDLFRT